MAVADKKTITLSTKGQVAAPKYIRQRRRWDAGTRLIVEDRAEGVLLSDAPVFAPTRPARVFASVEAPGRPRSLRAMDAGLRAETRRRHARD